MIDAVLDGYFPLPRDRFGVTAGRATVARWCRNARTRRALASLDAARLSDIGLDRAAADAEAARPFRR